MSRKSKDFGLIMTVWITKKVFHLNKSHSKYNLNISIGSLWQSIIFRTSCLGARVREKTNIFDLQFPSRVIAMKN